MRFFRILYFIALLLWAAPLLLAQNTITTVVGGGAPSGTATSADVVTPTGVAVDTSSNLYISQGTEASQVFKVTPAGIISVFAGSTFTGFGGDGGPATSAVFYQAIRLAFDSSENLYVADYANNRVRRIDAHTGIITTVAGSATACPGGINQPCGDGGLATQANLFGPEAVTFDGAGDMFIAEHFNERVRRVDAVTGIITTVAGTGARCATSPCGDGGLATQAQLNTPRGVAVDKNGNLFIADGGGIRRVDATTKIITTVVSPPDGANFLIIESSGNFLVTGGTTVYRVNSTTFAITTVAGTLGVFGDSGDGAAATSAKLANPFSVAEDTTGNIYIGQASANRVRKVDTSAQHIITTVAGGGSGGDGGPFTSAILGGPNGGTIDPEGNGYIADMLDNRIRRVTGGIITTLAGTGEPGSSGDGGPALSATLSLNPVLNGVVAEASGVVYFPDVTLNSIRRISGVGGTISSFAGGTLCANPTTACGDGGPATAASLNDPSGLAADSLGNIFIGDGGDSRVRRVDASTGIITTVAGNGTVCANPTAACGDGGPATAANLNSQGLGLAVDSAGDVFLTDGNDNRIRRVDATSGIITTIAGNGTTCATPGNGCGDGGPATSAQLTSADGVAVDSKGNVFIADFDVIRRVDATTGTIATVAGNATGGFSGDGGPALAAGLDFPTGMWVDPTETLFIADSNSNRIRKVALTPTAVFTGTINNFGSLLIGAHGTQTVTLTNKGGDTLSISGITLSGTGFASASTCANTNDQLAPLQSCAISVTFTPTAVGTSLGTLEITTNDTTTPSVTYSFGGTGATLALASIAVTPTNQTITAALTQQFAATGTYSDGSTQTLTDSVVWTSSSVATATINTSGNATGVAAGTTTITASSGTISASTGLTVAAPVLDFIEISPTTAFRTVGQTVQFVATGVYNNNKTMVLTSGVVWTSSSPANATINSSGLATGVALGSTTISAALGNVTSLVTGTLTVVPAGFTVTGSMNTPRILHTATLLPNGTVLVAGGEDANGNILNSAELYNPATGTFALTGSMNAPRVFHSAVLLNNGQVLMVGGDGGATADLGRGELYDPATGQFTLTGTLTNSFLFEATATLLKNGKVLIAGGDDDTGAITANAQLYDPSTGTFSATGSLITGRADHTAALLDNGQVLIAGGESNSSDTALASAELYNPATGTFSATTGSLGATNVFFTNGATLLNSGMVLIYGGEESETDALQLYNPATELFSNLTVPSGFLFLDNPASLLNNGTVLLAGGDVGGSAAGAPSYIFDPASGTTTNTGDLNLGRFFSTSTLLNNGDVLITGGESPSGNFLAVASAELYKPVSLTPANLLSIAITPAAPTIHTGAAEQFTATGTFVGGGTQILNSVTWTSSSTAVASITNGGTNGGAAFGLTVGSTTITACAGGACGSTLLTVTSGTAPTLTSIAVTPANPSVAAGLTQQFTATGTYSDGSTKNLTGSVTWSSGTAATATINTAGLAKGIAVGTSTIAATSGNVAGSTTLTVTAATLSSITVTPANPSVAAGLTQQFTATGTFSNGSTQNVTGSVTWSSSTTAIATITAAGLAKGVAGGSTTIKATSGNISGTTTLTVTLETLTISCSPSACGAVSGGEATNSDPIFSIGTPASTGLSGGTPTGVVELGVLLPEPTALSSWTLGTGSSSIASGTGVPGYVSGNVFPLFGLTTGESIDFSVFHALSAAVGVNAASYNAFTFGIATIHGSTSSGPITFTGFNGASSFPVGTIFFPYLLDSNQGNKVVNLGPIVVVNAVAAPTLASIAVTPANPSVAAGLTQQFTATGTYSDGSTKNLTGSVTWSSGTAAAATITAAGLAKGIAVGKSTITATSGNIAGSTTLTVTAPTLVSIAVTPANPSVAAGLTQQFTATGTFSDGSTQNLTGSVTWSSGTTATATITAAGLAKGVAVGKSTITATSGNISGSTTLTVTAPTLVSIAVTPATPTIAAGMTRQFTATGTFSNNTTQNLSSAVTWSSSAVGTATINATGLATGVAMGTTTIKATSASGVAGSTTLTVTAIQSTNFVYVPIPATNNIQTGLISTVPTGIFVANNALATPFSIPSAAGKCGPSGASPCNFYDGFGFSGNGKSITLSVSIANPTDVYTLMNAYSPPLGQQLATIEFVGTGGASLTFPLVAGQDIRDFAQGSFADTLTNGIAGVQALNAFSCVDPTNCLGAGGTGNVQTGIQESYVVDEQHFSLGSTFVGQTLTQIIITDTDNGPDPLLLGVTVGVSGLALAPSIAFNPTSLSFSNQLIGTTSPEQTVTVSNTGTAALTINSIALTGTNPAEFELTNVNCPIAPAMLGVNSSCSVQATFAPLAVGTRTTNISFTDNAGGVTGSVQNVPLTGTASAPAPVTTTVPLTYAPGVNVSQTATVNCPSGTVPCTDPNAHSLKLMVSQVNEPFTLTVTAYEVSLSEANGVCPAGQSETTNFNCRFKDYFTLQTEANGDVIVPQCVPLSNGNCVYYRISNVPPASMYQGPVFETFSYNNNAYVPSSFYDATNPRLYDDPDSPPYDINHQFVFDITDYFETQNKVGVDPTIHGHTKQYNDFVIAFTAGLPNPAYTLKFVAPLGSGSPSFVEGTAIPVAFTLTQGTTPIINALTSPNAVSVGVKNAAGVQLPALAPNGTAAAFTYNASLQQYTLTLNTLALQPGNYTLFVNSNLFVQQSTTFTITAAPLRILTAPALTAGTVGTPYSVFFTATGGTTPYTWSAITPALPPGLSLSSSGRLSGTPTTAGSYGLTVQVTDDVKATSEQQFTLTVGPAPPSLLSIAVTPANPTIGLGGTEPFTATGTFSNKTTQNLTSSVAWTSGTTTAATITAGGVAGAVAAGTSTITATLGSVSGSTALKVSAVEVLEPLIGFDPVNLTFANQVIGTKSAAQIITVSNTGSAPLTINSIALTGTNPAEFVLRRILVRWGLRCWGWTRAAWCTSALRR